jgi:hypothetical protein
LARIATRARAFVRLALLPRGTPNLEVDDQVGRADHRVTPVGSDAGVGVAVEGRRIERLVVRDLRTHLDLRRQPVLPAPRNVDIARLGAGPLAFHVVVPFQPQ